MSAALTASRTATALGALVLVVVAVLTLLSGRPPNPVPASAPAQEFSAERALGYLREFATKPRPLGSSGSDRTRDYLAGALRAAGFSVRIERAVGGFTRAGLASFGRVDTISSLPCPARSQPAASCSPRTTTRSRPAQVPPTTVPPWFWPGVADY